MGLATVTKCSVCAYVGTTNTLFILRGKNICSYNILSTQPHRQHTQILTKLFGDKSNVCEYISYYFTTLFIMVPTFRLKNFPDFSSVFHSIAVL